jgi:hypothetical protein
MSERRPPAPFARFVVVASLAAALAVPGSGMAAPGEAPSPARQASGYAAEPDVPLRLMVFTFRHQRAAEALGTIRTLLSTRGSVALEENTNSLSVRDTPAALARVTNAVRALDHEPRELLIDVQLIRAELARVSPAPSSVGISPDLLERLHQLFRYETFRLVARSRIATREGESVTYSMGDGYELAFRPGTSLDGRRLKLAGFAMRQGGGDAGVEVRELVRTAVNLRLEQPVILGLTRAESANSALMLALRYELPEPVAAPRPAE